MDYPFTSNSEYNQMIILPPLKTIFIDRFQPFLIHRESIFKQMQLKRHIEGQKLSSEPCETHSVEKAKRCFQANLLRANLVNFSN